ncbi:bacillithiol system protein YtxJ [Dyadobacter jejuensis]|uniref:Bacillithiol system protein YtxJ n=1 Tax=Dyadobacter jejuensis TaxID=1082580 RepID=A0A316AMB2_9BACT|nr:bacillithiol system redox-active protein YtxJ [Dyadobacter jejuensis]PWJ58716.1 bacillithiol system protein YtxJ [Dyadobacter jejuensis]
MNWITLSDEAQIEEIKNSEGYTIIYKHSPRCIVSMMAHRRLKSELPGFSFPDTPLYIVDVVKNRNESLAIASEFAVHHESPQLLLLKNGQAIYHASHEEVGFDPIMNLMAKTSQEA